VKYDIGEVESLDIDNNDIDNLVIKWTVDESS
jgi:hypothetical protein